MTEFAGRLEKLRGRFVARSCVERAQLETALAAADLIEVRRIAHSLSGAGGTFGFPAISQAAGDLEAAVDGGAGEELLNATAGALIALLRALR
jgi:HPt (histidine-containing phosphotransfer) domain-containing protein